MKLSVRITVFLSFALSGLAAQSSVVLDDYIRAGLNGNLALQQHSIDEARSLAAVRQARTLFYPTLQFNASYTRAAGGRSIDFPIGDLLNPVYASLNQILQTNAFPQLENQRVQFLPDNFQETKIKFAYPLFNSDLRYNRQLREHLHESEVAQRAAYETELRYEIRSAYLRYLQALQAENVWTNARTVLLELRRFNESLVRNNVATRDVVSTADYELSKTEREIAGLRASQNTARAYFNFLLNRDLQTDVIVDTLLLRPSVAALPDRDSLVALALSRRPELEALRAGLAASETAVKLQEATRRLPDLYIGGEAGIQGFGYDPANQGYVIGQIGLTYDLYDGGQNRSKAQIARLDAQQLRLRQEETQRQLALQVLQAWNELSAARSAWETSQTGVTAAEASFRIVQNKYRAQQLLLIEYLEAQNRVTTAREQVVLAVADLRLKEAFLARAVGQ